MLVLTRRVVEQKLIDKGQSRSKFCIKQRLLNEIPMRKMIAFSMLFLSMSVAHADDRDIWERIGWLQTQIGLLQNQIVFLKQQIANIPAGPQGIPGPQGEQGPQGPQGEQGEHAYYQPGEGIIIEGDVISTSNKTHQLGENYQGGLIFWLDETGQHGLIASKFDLNDNQGIQWRNGDSGNKITNAYSDGIGAGASNTRLIIAQQTPDNQSGSFAALVAARFSVLEDGETPCNTPASPNTTCYGDWYLPSIYELTLLKIRLQLRGIVNFVPDFYWSSTEADVANAWLQNFSTGEIVRSDKASTLGHVRAVRKF
jgi:Protein of unknown function (DUF1566)